MMEEPEGSGASERWIGSFDRFEQEALSLAEILAKYGRDAASGVGAVVRQIPMVQLADDLQLRTYLENGGLAGEALQAFWRGYLANTTRLRHPGYMAHQVAVPHAHAVLGAMVDAFTNNGMNIYEMGPAASTIEYTVVNWLLAAVGWQPAPWPHLLDRAGRHGAGLLTHGGSLANLTALLAARARAFPNAWREGYQQRPAILAPRSNHYSIKRAAAIMGMGSEAVVTVRTDDREVLVPDDLPHALRRARQDGFTPFAVVANACATAAGLYDPLDELADACREHGLWLHVDGAHGAAAVLAPETRHLMRGIEKADSLVWDAHKMLATNTLCAAVLVREAASLYGALQQDASYLFHVKEQPGFDFIEHTVECTKAAMGLRLFLVLAALGRQGMAAHVTRLFNLGLRAWQVIGRRACFEAGPEPQCNIVLFRYRGTDQTQLELRKQLMRSGEFHISSTLFGGRRYLRLALMNPLTDEATIAALLDRIEALAGPS